jgi:hypothetical protein
MIDMLKRHEIQVLRRAEHTWNEIAALSGRAGYFARPHDFQSISACRRGRRKAEV